MVDPEIVPPIINDVMDVVVEFPKIEPMMSRTEELANFKAELELKTITREYVIRKLHPDFSDDMVAEILAGDTPMLPPVVI